MQDTTIKTDNLIGCLLFWLYILAALSLTCLILFDLIKLQSHSSDGDKKNARIPSARRNQARTFMALAAVSFSVLSLHMLYFLIDNFQAWAKLYEVKVPRDLTSVFNMQAGLDVWKWSESSTLFKDFAKDLCEDPRHYWWASQALAYSFGWNTMMTVQGINYKIPHLWSYIVLGQVLPVSFAQNLFCTALFLSPSPVTAKTLQPPSFKRQAAVVSAFYSALLIAPAVVHTSYDAPTLLLTRVLLTAPYLFLRPVWSLQKKQDARHMSGSFKYSASLIILGFVVLLCIQSWRAGSILLAIKSLHDTHAVSALGYGYLMGAGSLALFLLKFYKY